MKREFVVAAIAAILVVSAAEAGAKPINYIGAGCAYRTLVNSSFTYEQSFRATFSVLRKARFVLFGASPATDEDVTFVIQLKNSDGTQILDTSLGGVLSAGTSFEDAQAGEAVTFTFDGGAQVIPGQSYRLELVRVSGDSSVYACEVQDPPQEGYDEGFFFWEGNQQQAYDLEFAVKGSGPPK